MWPHGAVGQRLPLPIEGKRSPSVNQSSYEGLRNYMLGVAGHSPRTFNLLQAPALFSARGRGAALARAAPVSPHPAPGAQLRR